MITISFEVPDTLYRQAVALAEREQISLDQFIAIALTREVARWEVITSFKDLAASGNWDDLRRILN